MTKLAVFLTQEFADWECALLMAASRSYYKFDVITASIDAKPVVSAGGLNVTPDLSVGQLRNEKIDALAICGGSIWQDKNNAPDITNVLTGLAQDGVIIGAICDANLALAKTGLLNKVAHSANAPDALSQIANYSGSARYKDQPQAVRDQNIITAAGTSPISFAREMLLALGQDVNEVGYYTGLYANEHMPTRTA